ncbi:molybdenum ABC transporter ATP-binding protein [Mariprofundus ferrooxydans]|uniref:molybdenum ABC transporter ATP-binding protein n=1 Tax=Mariprofundus ferrooxydans TaxID=314344 RepID=UPI000364D175|nr:molybdenum ABC transporter ATP-binding protein [Mariprofundus ferrooxydans]
MSAIELQFKAQHGAFTLDVELTLPDRGVTALFGHSGSGKTTLLRAIAGLTRCAGRMRFSDLLWQDDAAGLFLPVEKRPVAYVFQEASLFAHLSVRGNLEYGYARTPAAARRISFDEAVAWLGLGKLLERRPAGLSGGERQRVAIARALLVSPALLLMDEPLSALDARAKAEILPYLESLHRELAIPVVYVTHAIEEVARLADYIVQMEGGRVVAGGPAMSLLSSLQLRPVEYEEPGAVIEAEVSGHDDIHSLSMLRLPGNITLLAPRLAAEPGALVRVRIPAREISLSLTVPEGTSILNILPVRIAGVREGEPGRMLVQLELGDADTKTQLLSRISRYSWERLGLKIGMTVQAQIKSMGLARS